MKRKQPSIAPISNQETTIRSITRRRFLGTGLVAGIGAAVLAPRIASSLQAREAKALIGQWPTRFYKGMCYSAFPAPYDPSHANDSCIFFGSDIAYNPMQPLWGSDYRSKSGMEFPGGRKDLATMDTMGVTLVRLYDWEPRNDHLQFLNRCQNLGIKVLAPVSNYFLIRGQGFEQRQNLIPKLIKSYRNVDGTNYHPAIAGIIMGNEPRIANKFGVDELTVFTKDWVRIEQEQFSGFSLPPIGHPVDFGKLANERFPQWNFWRDLLGRLKETETRDLQNRLFLAPQPQNGANYLFENAESSGEGYVQQTYAQFQKPLLFTELGKDRTKHDYLNVIDGQLNGAIAYGAQHPEQLKGICYFQFADKVWKCPRAEGCTDSEGSFGVFSHTDKVLLTVNYVDEDFTIHDRACDNQQLKPDVLKQNPVYEKIVAAYKT